MDVRDAVIEISKRFNVDFNDPIPFEGFTVDDYFNYYASILTTIQRPPSMFKSITLSNLGIDTKFLVRVNEDERFNACISGYDDFDKVMETIDYLNDAINLRTLDLPRNLPGMELDFKKFSLEDKLRLQNYRNVLDAENQRLLKDPFLSPEHTYVLSDYANNVHEIEYHKEDDGYEFTK